VGAARGRSSVVGDGERPLEEVGLLGGVHAGDTRSR
jgi:hypothetical protein